MAKYIYNKYNAVYNPTTYKMVWTSSGNIHGWSNVCVDGSLVGNSFTTSRCGRTIDAGNDGNPVGYTVYKIENDGTIRRFIKRRTGTNGYEAFKGEVVVNTSAYYSKGTTDYGPVVAEDGTYPPNGRHSDGYWYVRGALVPPGFTVKMDGAIKTSDNGWVKIDGQLREIDSIKVKIDGVLKEV